MIIIALGNHGNEYTTTRHNAGWLVVDQFGLEWNINKYAESLDARDADFIFVKPQTFMNRSGQSALWYKKEHNLEGKDFIIVYDDVALPIGTIRISYDRSSGGHNGIKSIESGLGTAEFVRVRIGIAPINEEGDMQTLENRKDFVLKNFSIQEQKTLISLSPRIKEIVSSIKHDGFMEAMNRFN